MQKRKKTKDPVDDEDGEQIGEEEEFYWIFTIIHIFALFKAIFSLLTSQFDFNRLFNHKFDKFSHDFLT